MNTLDGPAVDAVAKLAREAAGNHTPIVLDGENYASRETMLARVPRPIPTPDTLTVTTLGALVEFAKQRDTGFDEADRADDRLIHIVSPTEVRLVSRLSGHELQRHTYAKAVPVLPESLAQTFTTEMFIIALQSRVVPSEDRDQLIALASSVRAGSEVGTDDDGFSQTLSGKAGVSMLRTSAVKNPVKLAPYRTFAEVEQPEGQYIVRAKQSGNPEHPVNFTLIEADGGAWRITAVARIREWLAAQDLKLPILA